MDADELVLGLDADQREAVTNSASPLAIIASAGSGKTMVLTRRIAFRIATDPDVQAQHVLAITFTNQASRELQHRLRRAGLRDRVESGTFHAIALRLLRQRASDAGQRPPSVATDRMRLLQEALRQIGSRDDPQTAMAELDWLRARCVPVHDYGLSARAAGRRTQISPTRLAQIADAYATVKHRRGVVDFDDLLERCVHAFGTDKLWAAGVRWRFRHLFVDEAQDLNPLQHRVLESIRNQRPDVCLVGDPRQAIFGFNGADPEIMNNVENLYPGVTIVRLRHNYRCSPQIIEAGRRVLAHAGQADDTQAVATDGAAVRVVGFDNEGDEADGSGRIVRELVGVHRPWGSCAILARTTNQLALVGRALERMGIPINVQGRSARNQALASALAEAFAQRSAAELGVWIEEVAADDHADPVRTRVAETADRYLARGGGMTFRAWVDLNDPFDDLEQAARVDAVDLMTLHGAKGREWPSVIIVGAEVGLLPHSSATTRGQRNEETRLLYVACTRAREQLVVTWSASRNERRSQVSPMISGLDTFSISEVIGPPIPRPPRAEPDPVYVALVAWRKTAARAADVEPESICSDESLRAVAQARPTSPEALAYLIDLGPIAAGRVAPRLLTALNRALDDLGLDPPRRATAASGRTPPASSR